jgi:MSHA pilin protein MshC
MAIRNLCLGFTLVELVAVLVLVGILGAVTGPSFFDNNSYSERGYADEVATAIRHAQRVATASNCDVVFTISPVGYSAMQRAVAGATCAPAGAWITPVLRSDGLPLAGVTPQGAAVVANSVVVFAGNGEPDAAASAIVIGPHTINVAATTGLVTVQQ